jgi:putative ABC transport system permease protein
LKLLTGRFYSKDLAADANKALVNETFVSQNKISNPVGLKFKAINGTEYEIVGVVKDFHYKPINQPIAALAILNEPYASFCLINLKAADYNELHKNIEEIKTLVSGLSPSFPVEVSFMDQAVEKIYSSEIQFRRIFFLFSISAVVICALGILAISLFISSKRTKEIGIRKTNGARDIEVIVMLNQDFIKWVAIAFIIACPIAWYAMHKWLENFAYKTEMSWWVFAAAGAIALFIALLTVSWQSWRAATRNPVKSLRHE